MAKKKPTARKKVAKAAAKKPRRAAPARKRRAKVVDPLLARVKGAERREIGHVQLEVEPEMRA